MGVRLPVDGQFLSHVALQIAHLSRPLPIAHFGWLKFSLKQCLCMNQQNNSADKISITKFYTGVIISVIIIPISVTFEIKTSDSTVGYIWNKLPSIKQILHLSAVWPTQCISDCYFVPSNSREMASLFASVTSEEIIQIKFCGVYYLTVLVLYILQQLFTSVLAASSRYWISTAIHLHFGEYSSC